MGNLKHWSGTGICVHRRLFLFLQEMKNVPRWVYINSWLLFACAGVRVRSTVSLQDRQAAHAGLLREIVFKMVISTEGARRPQKSRCRDQWATSWYHALVLTGLFASFPHSQPEDNRSEEFPLRNINTHATARASYAIAKPGSRSTKIPSLLTKLAMLRHGLLQNKSLGRGYCVPAPQR